MFRRDATPGARALILVLAVHVCTCFTGRAAETGPDRVSPDVLKLWQSSRELALRTHSFRRESVRFAERSRNNSPAPGQRASASADSQNFRVVAPAADGLAEHVLQAAEQYRREIALTWLGQELPAGTERTIIHIETADDRDVGLAMLDNGRVELRNRIWLQTSPDKAIGSTLAHEMAHIVLSAKFPHGMPVWATEGISCQYDDEVRVRRRQLLLRQFVRTGRWPSLMKLLSADEIVPNDEASYTAAVSLTDYFVARADRETFLWFVADGIREGWNTALARHYGIRSIEELEARWHAAVAAAFSISQDLTTRASTGTAY